MIVSRPHKSDTVLVVLGALIFLLLCFGIFFVVRKQPADPHQAPGAPGSSVYRAPRTATS